MSKRWILPLLGLTAVITTAFVRVQGGDSGAQDASAQAAVSSVQPIAFPHDIHAGQFQIDCQYCHFSAERSQDAGIPDVATCMGCHTILPGRNNPEEVNKVREYWNNGEAIPWVRIYKVSDHVRFPHMRHVSAGVDCTTCHGNVPEIGVIEEVAQPLAMGWCVDCHVQREVSRDCTVCHY